MILRFGPTCQSPIYTHTVSPLSLPVNLAHCPHVPNARGGGGKLGDCRVKAGSPQQVITPFVVSFTCSGIEHQIQDASKLKVPLRWDQARLQHTTHICQGAYIGSIILNSLGSIQECCLALSLLLIEHSQLNQPKTSSQYIPKANHISG